MNGIYANHNTDKRTRNGSIKNDKPDRVLHSWPESFVNSFTDQIQVIVIQAIIMSIFAP